MPKFYCGATSQRGAAVPALRYVCMLWYCAVPVTAAQCNCIISALPNANNVTQLQR